MLVSKDYFMFTPNLREKMFQISLDIFLRWVGGLYHQPSAPGYMVRNHHPKAPEQSLEVPPARVRQGINPNQQANDVGKFGVFFEMSQKASGFFKYP